MCIKKGFAVSFILCPVKGSKVNLLILELQWKDRHRTPVTGEKVAPTFKIRREFYTENTLKLWITVFSWTQIQLQLTKEHYCLIQTTGSQEVNYDLWCWAFHSVCAEMKHSTVQAAATFPPQSNCL